MLLSFINCEKLLQFFNHVLILGREEKTLTISQKVYDLIYELNHICPSVLLAVLPQVCISSLWFRNVMLVLQIFHFAISENSVYSYFMKLDYKYIF